MPNQPSVALEQELLMPLRPTSLYFLTAFHDDKHIVSSSSATNGWSAKDKVGVDAFVSGEVAVQALDYAGEHDFHTVAVYHVSTDDHLSLDEIRALQKKCRLKTSA